MNTSQVPKYIACRPITWGPFLLQTSLEEYILDDLLERASKIRNDPMYNAEHMLAADMHDEWNYPPMDTLWFNGELKPYIDLYLDGLSHHIERRVCPDYEIDNLWINYQHNHDYNPIHNHRGDLSFILYLNFPEEILTEKERYNMIGTGPLPGSIVFIHGESTRMNDCRKFFVPKRGDLYIFPSSLMHTVIPFKTPDVERISVAGNITFK